MKKKDNSNPISDILPGIIQQKGWEVQLELYDIFRNWAELVGEEVASCTRPLKVERAVLWVEVENSAWLQELQYQKIWILDELNSFLRLSHLADVRLVLQTTQASKEKKKSPKIKFVPPPEKEFEAFKKKTEWIDDEGCREALINFWYLSHAYQLEDEDR